jgi:predicted nucleotidyltransferase
VKWVDLILFSIIQKPEVRCDYFKWRDLEICIYGQRVVSRLRDWDENLKAEHELSRINRLDEVGKYNNEVEKCMAEAEKYKFKLQRQKDKFRSVERKYQIALVCSWVMLM